MSLIESGSAGGWIETYTGHLFYPLSPNRNDVEILDIAQSLSMLCRFGGHSKYFYSIAAHCCILSDYVVLDQGREGALIALLHDASEAYIGDMVRPLKYHLDAFKDIERKVDAAVFGAFGLPAELPGWMKDIDNRILCDERAQVMLTRHNDWITDTLEPLGVVLPRWTPEQARDEFMRRFESLSGADPITL